MSTLEPASSRTASEAYRSHADRYDRRTVLLVARADLSTMGELKESVRRLSLD